MKFSIENCWNTEEGLKVLRERKVSVGNNLTDRDVAVLEYPTIDFEYEAWLKSGDEPWEVEENDEFNGAINFSIFVCLKGIAPKHCKEYADENGLMWESHEYVNDIEINDVDFASDDWKQKLEAELTRVAEIYVEKHNFSFDKPNF